MKSSSSSAPGKFGGKQENLLLLLHRLLVVIFFFLLLSPSRSELFNVFRLFSLCQRRRWWRNFFRGISIRFPFCCGSALQRWRLLASLLQRGNFSSARGWIAWIKLFWSFSVGSWIRRALLILDGVLRPEARGHERCLSCSFSAPIGLRKCFHFSVLSENQQNSIQSRNPSSNWREKSQCGVKVRHDTASVDELRKAESDAGRRIFPANKTSSLFAFSVNKFPVPSASISRMKFHSHEFYLLFIDDKKRFEGFVWKLRDEKSSGSVKRQLNG